MTVEELHAELAKQIAAGHGWYVVVDDTNREIDDVSTIAHNGRVALESRS